MHQQAISDSCSISTNWSPSKTPITRVRLFPDEPTFSYLTRIGLLTATSSRSRLAGELFGVTDYSLIDFGLHGGLGRLERLLASSDGEPITDLAEKHTMLSFYRPFVDSSLFREAIVLANNAPGWGFLRLIGAKARTTRQTPAACLDCIEEDIADEGIGIAYYRRVHQVIGVRVCPRHGSQLVTKCQTCGASMDFAALPNRHCHACSSLLRPCESEFLSSQAAKFITSYVEVVAACLDGSFPVLDEATRLAVVEARIEELTGSTMLDVRDHLLNCISANFGRQRLDSFHLTSDTWQKSLIQGWFGNAAPISNCIVVAALFDSIGEYRQSVSAVTAEQRLHKSTGQQLHAFQSERQLLLA
ncbi:MAG: hypothetical protein H6R13_1806 [Proteobacteria bacterium]|nr:hypothetical protein [Pseudomonadota bacterium]